MADSASTFVKKQDLLRFLMAGYTVRECAHLISVSYHTTLKYCRDIGFRGELKTLSKEVWQRLEVELEGSRNFIQSRVYEISDKALVALEQLVDGARNESAKLGAVKVALDLDDRIDRRDVTVKHIHLRPEDLQTAAVAITEASGGDRNEPDSEISQ